MIYESNERNHSCATNITAAPALTTAATDTATTAVYGLWLSGATWGEIIPTLVGIHIHR